MFQDPSRSRTNMGTLTNEYTIRDCGIRRVRLRRDSRYITIDLHQIDEPGLPKKKIGFDAPVIEVVTLDTCQCPCPDTDCMLLDFMASLHMFAQSEHDPRMVIVTSNVVPHLYDIVKDDKSFLPLEADVPVLVCDAGRYLLELLQDENAQDRVDIK